jgi:hypothetical protein
VTSDPFSPRYRRVAPLGFVLAGDRIVAIDSILAGTTNILPPPLAANFILQTSRLAPVEVAC